MSRLQSIENALRDINETVFQELCDSLLIRRNLNYAAFSRTGSQAGKQKTIKGTPDSLFLLPNGKYLFVEYSTNSSEGVNKLIKDIEKCIDPAKSTISNEDIDEIILCLNFKLKTSDVQKLKLVLENTDINLTINTLDSLAIELQLHHRDLAHQYLGISLDTGQVVSMQVFIKEYNNASKGIATRLDNPFIHRESELQILKNNLLNDDFIILTGSAGVGKTKLALEAIKNFIVENPHYETYCISYKHHTLLNDLYQYLDNNKNYILFVDDANRIDAFNQILGFFKSSRKGLLKIITTVRDYAYQEMRILCHEFEPKKLILKKFKNEEIIDIIKSEPYNITNSDYLDIIISIADGNPRIGIMAAKLAIKNQNIDVLRDISDLFESYFITFIKDNNQFSKEFNIKCLGLIGFFYTIPYKDQDKTSSILKLFNIDYPDFIETIEKLDRLELVEIQFDHVKISEQNLAIYFFYRAFIKDSLLSFDILLENYFELNQNRFDENIISANNMFDHKKVMSKLYDSLVKHWEKNKNNDHEKSLKFLSSFWFYLQNQSLEYIYDVIQSLPEIKIEKYNVSYETNDFVYNQNEIIKLLGNFFKNTNNLREALELAFEYAKKKPEHLPELIHKIVEVIGFEREDESNIFLRQNILFEILLQKLSNNETIYAYAFFELSKTFLKFEFAYSRGARNHKILSHLYRTPNNLSVKKFRSRIWDTINQFYSHHPTLALGLLENYEEVHLGISKELMKFDMPFILAIVNQHLSSESFEHCKYVQDQIYFWKSNKLQNDSLNSLIEKYTNDTYKTFLIINWDRIRDKERYDFENYREYDRLKEQEIRTSFVFSDVTQVKSFYEKFKYLKTKAPDNWEYFKSLDFVIDENYKRNSEIGYELLEEVMRDNNSIGYVPEKVFENNLQDLDETNNFWQLISNKEYMRKSSWEIYFLYSIHDSLINSAYINQLTTTVKNIYEHRTYIDFKYLLKFIKTSPYIFQTLLKIITEKNEIEKVEIIVNTDSFENDLQILNNDINLAKKNYLQQNKIQHLYDYDGNGFTNILKQDTSFLLDYAMNFHQDSRNNNSGNNKKLSLIWQINDIEASLSQVFDYFASTESYMIGIGKNYCNVFFKDLNLMNREKAANFLRKYCINNYQDPNRISLLMDIIRHSLSELYENIILLFLTLTQDSMLFSQIYWNGNGGTVISGNVNIGDMHAAEWRSILSILEKSSIGIALLPIKSYINKRVEYYLEYADRERKRRFITRN